MSASREKKTRQELAASGAPDPKQVRLEEEARQQKRSNRLYGLIALAFVVIAAALLLWNSNVIQRSSAAMTIDGTKYSAADVDYYYHSVFNNLLQDQYASYLGLSATMDRSAKLNDMAKLYLGVDDDEMTWDEYLKKGAAESLTQIQRLNERAKAEGFTFTAEMQKELDDNMATLKKSAADAGMSAGSYVKALFGNNMTLSKLKSLLKDSLLASHYYTSYRDALTYTDEQLEEYYGENKASLDVVSYEYIYFSGSASSTKDAEGKTVEPTDEEKAVAKTAANAAANAALERYAAGESLEDIAAELEIATYGKQEAASVSSTNLGTWLFDEERKADDVAVIDSDPSTYLAVFHSRSRNEAPTVDVRHILFAADTSALDQNAETYEADVQAVKDAAKAKAEKALNEWKSGEATEESFAAMANELSEDPGSNTNGGLYTNVTEGAMVEAFNDWIFDESRSAGDTDIVETNYGYHVMYFVGGGDVAWKNAARSALLSADMTAWQEELVKDAVVENLSGMKYVG